VGGGPNGLENGSNGTRVFFTASNGGVGALVDVDGAAPQPIGLASVSPPAGDPVLLNYNTLLYAAPQAGGPIWACHGAGSLGCPNGGSAFVDPLDASQGVGTLRHFVLRAGTLWMATDTGIWSALAQQSPPVSLAYPSPGARTIAVDALGTRIFWAVDGAGIYAGSISGVAVSGVTLVLPRTSPITGMILDGVALYFAERDPGTVAVYSAIAGTLEVVMDGLAQPAGLAVDPTYVFATSGDGRIVRAKRSR
jgi:hypothetical protein